MLTIGKGLELKEYIFNSIEYYKAAEGPGFEEKQKRYTQLDNGEVSFSNTIKLNCYLPCCYSSC